MSTRRRTDPYFKVQVFDSRSLTWMEHRQAFDSLSDARIHVEHDLADAETRIVMVDRDGYHPVKDIE